MKSEETEKSRFNKNVYLAVLGKCSGCHYCANVCPNHAITETTPPTINSSRCTRCMKCVDACPRNIIKTVQ